MNGNQLVSRLKLSKEDFEAILKAVREEELRTNGEIALAATPESSDYSFHELFASVALGALAFAAALPLYAQVTVLLDRLFWHVSPWYASAFYGILGFGVIALFFLFANIPAIDRLVIPRAARHRAVFNRALRHFVESGVYGTRDRTGILIFISYMEKEVRIIADTGISSKIEQSQWDDIARIVAGGVHEGKVSEALLDAIAKCGDLLAAHFPAKTENPNELADGLVILEGGE